MKIAREGVPFILISLGIAFGVVVVFGWRAGAVFFILPLFVTWFFRDPERSIPEGEGLVLSPADGKVISIGEVEEKRYLRKPLRRISIFLSILNVHVNRIPFTGRVKRVEYHPGRFLIGFAEKASQGNEQNGIVIEGEKGREVLFVQIAGFVARRIVCYLKGGEEVAMGQRFGLIRFGSRMDVYLPRTCELSVHEGESVKGGETVLGRF